MNSPQSHGRRSRLDQTVMDQSNAVAPRHPSPWRLLLVAVLTLASVTDVIANQGSDPDAAQTGWDPQNLITVDPEDPPPDILTEAEMERWEALSSATTPSFKTPLSPDGQTVLVWAESMTDRQIGLWDIPTGELRTIDWPVTLVEPRYAAWISNERARLISLDSETMEYRVLELDRQTLQVWLQSEPLPIDGDITAISPDGRRLAVLTAIEPEDEEVETAQAGEPRSRDATNPEQAGSKAGRARSVRKIRLPTEFSASGEFLSNELQVTAEPALLSVFDLDTHTAIDIYTQPVTSALGGLSFSPDGSRLALIENHFLQDGLIDPARNGIFQSLTALFTQDALGLLPPAQNPQYLNSRLLVFNLQAPSAQPLEISATTLQQDFGMFRSAAPVWSPTGNRLLATLELPAALSGREWPTYFKPEARRHLVFDTSLNPLVSIDAAPISFPDQPDLRAWLNDDELLFAAVAGAQHRLYHYRLSQSTLSELAAVGTLRDIATLPGSDQALLVRDDASTAPEIWSLGLSTGALTQQSELNAEATAAANVVAHPIDFTLGNGEQFSGYWFAPADMAWPPVQQPVVFWNAGGPGGSMTNSWGTDVEAPLTLLPSFGISVMMVPLHQRPGDSPQVWNALADGENFGKIDIDAMAEIATHLVALGWASPDGLGVSGCSYGGYMTSQSIVRHPTLWSAANPQCSLVDLISEFQVGYGAHIAYLMGATPWGNWLHYIDASPGYHGALVQTPTLVFHGSRDFLSLAVMENFFYDIVEAGVADARMLRFVGEGHGLRLSSSQRYAAQEQIRWFRQYLQ